MPQYMEPTKSQPQRVADEFKEHVKNCLQCREYAKWQSNPMRWSHEEPIDGFCQEGRIRLADIFN